MGTALCMASWRDLVFVCMALVFVFPLALEESIVSAQFFAYPFLISFPLLVGGPWSLRLANADRSWETGRALKVKETLLLVASASQQPVHACACIASSRADSRGLHHLPLWLQDSLSNAMEHLGVVAPRLPTGKNSCVLACTTPLKTD